MRSDEGAAREPVHHCTRDRIDGDTLDKAHAAGRKEEPQHQSSRDDRHDLLDAALAGADFGDVLGNRGATVGAYAAALHYEISVAFGAFDFGP